MPDNLKKAVIKAKIDIKQQSQASNEATIDKMYITFDLLHTVPDINGNGETFDVEATKAKANSIQNGYINIEHDSWFNAGSVLDSKFVDIEESGKIVAEGVLWKSVLGNFGITPDDLKGDEYKISMEVLYSDYYYLVDGEKVEAQGNEHLDEHVGQTFEGDFVARVIEPAEFTGCALTKTAADSGAVIKEAIASITDEVEDGSEANIKDDNEDLEQKNGGADMFKELSFETEEEYNDFVDGLREGYASVDSVLSKFAEVDLEGEDLDSVVESVASIQSDLEDTQAKYESKKEEIELKERKASLEEVGVEVEEEDEKDIVEMSEKAFAMLVDSNKEKKEQMEKGEASEGDKDEDFKFDPNAKVSEEDFNVKDGIDAL